MTPHAERRRTRSDDPLVALHFQLAYVRRERALDTVVIADDAGFVVAGAGAWAACEELAAYAPVLADPAYEGSFCDAEVSRVAELRDEVDVQAVPVGGQRILVCARGGLPGRALAARTTAGAVARILGRCG